MEARPAELKGAPCSTTAILHDHEQVARGVVDQLEIGQRVAVHQQQVGQCALLHHAELSSSWP